VKRGHGQPPCFPTAGTSAVEVDKLYDTVGAHLPLELGSSFTLTYLSLISTPTLRIFLSV